MSDRFESLESGEVVSIQHETQVLSGHRTFRAGELSNAIESYVEQAIAGWSEDKKDWFTDRGIDCEALRFGSKGWQKGRIRLSLEFCPDEPEMPALSASNSQTPVTTYLTDAPVSAPSTPTPVASHEPEIPALSASNSQTPVTTYFTDAPASAPSTPTPVASHDEILALESEDAIATNSATTIPDRLKTAIPVGIAATGTVAAATMFSLNLEPITNSKIPHLADTVLEPEHHDLDPTSPISGSLEELDYTFDKTNDDRGQLIPPGMMEMDLADGIDYSDHDLLSFEANGLSDDAEGFGSFQDIGRPEYSGALIDEVWTEVDRANWPKVN
jgi:KGK domain